MQLTLSEIGILCAILGPLAGWIWRTEVRLAKQDQQLKQQLKEMGVLSQIGVDLRVFMSNVLDRLARIETRLEERNH